jgi:hypothetical protein
MFHRHCFRCNDCNVPLVLGSAVAVSDSLYCFQHAGNMAAATSTSGHDDEQVEAVVDVLASLTAILDSSKEPTPDAPNSSPVSSTLTVTDSHPMAKNMAAAAAAARFSAQPSKLTPTSDVMDRRLSVSVKNGELTQKRALAAAQWVDKEIRKLIAAMIDLGAPSTQGLREIAFGKLFAETAQMFEALSGTLKTAKKKKVVTFATEMLLQGAHDNVIIVLLQDHIPDATTETCAVVTGFIFMYCGAKY